MANYRISLPALSTYAASTISATDSTSCVLWTPDNVAALNTAITTLQSSSTTYALGLQWSGVAYNGTSFALNIRNSSATSSITVTPAVSVVTLGSAPAGLTVLIADPSATSGAGSVWRLGTVTVAGNYFLVGTQAMPGTTRVSVAITSAGGTYTLGQPDTAGEQWFNLNGAPTARGQALTTFALAGVTSGTLFAETAPNSGNFTAVTL